MTLAEIQTAFWAKSIGQLTRITQASGGNPLKLFNPKQTNTGLYVQMYERGFGKQDIARVHDAYGLASKMFNGRYRKTGRAFICHAVGAASASAQFCNDTDTVIASLMHAAYDSGQFPDGRIGKTTPQHRDFMIRSLGVSVENILVNWMEIDFEKGDPERLVRDSVENLDQRIIFMSLTHEVDDLADGGLAIAPKYGVSIESRVRACAELARAIGHEELAEAIESQGAKHEQLSWLQELKSEQLKGFWIVPNIKAYCRLRRFHSRGKSAKLF